MTYGRQLPHSDAGVIGEFARINNYPQQSVIKHMGNKDKFGIKAVFCSNSFAAYRRESLEAVGMFPNDVILSEDTYVCAKMILQNLKVAYVADAKVYHSHDYSIIQEFKRYFDIGVFYGKESWINKEFSKAEREGINFLFQQIKYIIGKRKAYLIPSVISRNICKYVGYKLGQKESFIPISLKKKLSMHKKYWDK
ncbi:glycosyltransferase [Shouchella clausii KSM-K16]|uniref:Glycosyltransferase n=2 Tax=Shouchella clausii TaxID=79880 RepID=Q5WBN5_SHOC1|nr:glycosyltransferase [Shouchella clausii KSM-K16]